MRPVDLVQDADAAVVLIDLVAGAAVLHPMALRRGAFVPEGEHRHQPNSATPVTTVRSGHEDEGAEGKAI